MRLIIPITGVLNLNLAVIGGVFLKPMSRRMKMRNLQRHIDVIIQAGILLLFVK